MMRCLRANCRPVVQRITCASSVGHALCSESNVWACVLPPRHMIGVLRCRGHGERALRVRRRTRACRRRRACARSTCCCRRACARSIWRTCWRAWPGAACAARSYSRPRAVAATCSACCCRRAAAPRVLRSGLNARQRAVCRRRWCAFSAPRRATPGWSCKGCARGVAPWLCGFQGREMRKPPALSCLHTLSTPWRTPAQELGVPAAALHSHQPQRRRLAALDRYGRPPGCTKCSALTMRLIRG